MNPVYMDCNASTPMEPAVLEFTTALMADEPGNSGSRTHEWGVRSQRLVQDARSAIAAAIAAKPEEVVFTSGATESNNLAILGLAAHGEKTGRRHLVSTQIEHKAVLEPLEYLRGSGFDVTLVPPTSGGWIDPEAILQALRSNTLLVSVMHVNNETGVAQSIPEICGVLADHPAFFHVDAAQGFGKEIEPLCSRRIDLLSLSGHKIYGPKGVGALVVRRRGFKRVPLSPIMFGGGQERGLRPGTLPVPLVAGLGKAATMASQDHLQRASRCAQIRTRILTELAPLDPQVNGDLDRVLPHTLNLSIAGVDSEAAMVALKDLIAISNGSACTSASYSLSHVLLAMGLPEERIRRALRVSWCHMTNIGAADWGEVVRRLTNLR